MEKKYHQYFLKLPKLIGLAIWITMFAVLYVPWQRHTLSVVVYDHPGYADYLKLLFVTISGILFLSSILKIMIRMFILND